MRRAAVVEVLLAFALMHVAFRAVKRFMPWGGWDNQEHTNLSPGLAMIGVALLFLFVRARKRADSADPLAAVLVRSGLTLRPFLDSARAGLVCLLCLSTVGLAFVACGAPLSRPPVGPGVGVTLAGISLIATVATLWVLERRARLVARIPEAVVIAVVVAVPAAPILIAAATGRPIGVEVLEVVSLVVCAGVGEEVFFRGYVQSRLNEAFGRPWRLLGVSFGPGLVLAAALFALVHVLNPADYFAGTWRFAWWHGLATLAALHYGFLRERTGSIVAPVIVHAFSNILARLPVLF